jgi:hypothetical protein
MTEPQQELLGEAKQPPADKQPTDISSPTKQQTPEQVRGNSQKT